ncbi:MAG: penicillin-binding protein 1A [Stellaceae bacterium]
MAIAASGLVGLALWYFGRQLPNYQQLAHYEPPIATRVYAADGRLLAEYAKERRIFVPIEAIPPLVKQAFLAAEDKNFYVEHGIDPVSIVRAALLDIARLRAHRRPIGASTITQQVAKNMLLSNQLSVARKIKEILLATRLDATLPKARILELYLNQIYLGSGAYGVAAAALTYFDKPLDQLTLSEAAFLGGLPKAPNRYDPKHFSEAAKARRDWVIDRMVEDGDVTPQQAAAAKAAPLTLHSRRPTEVVNAPYFAEEVRRELLARYGERMLYEGGLTVRTSLDPKMQAAADKALRAHLIAYDRSHDGWRGPLARIDRTGDWAKRLARVPVPAVAGDVGWRLAVILRVAGGSAEIGFANGARGRLATADLRWARRGRGGGIRPDDVVMVAPVAAAAAPAAREENRGQGGLYTLCQVPRVSGALVALDPHTGRVLALSGGFSFALSQFDRAIQAERQPGSAIKPFVYLTALGNDFTPSTLVLDAPVSIPLGHGLPPWTPTNYDNEYMGKVPLMVALAHSLNAATARIALRIGMDAIAQTVERFDIMDHMPRQYSMALGAGDTTPLRLTAAYAMLDNGGKRIIPILIDRVEDRYGRTIYRADQRACPACSHVAWTHQPVPQLPDTRPQVADPASAFQVVSMLEGVVERGTGRAVRAVNRPVAGKTGTTNNFRDAWFVGFTPDLAAGTYVGFDEPKSLGKGEQAAVVAAPIFRDFLIAALKGMPPKAFKIPPGVELYRVDPRTGLPASGGSAVYMPYKPGTAPGKDRDFALRGRNGPGVTPVAERIGVAGPAAGGALPNPMPLPANNAPGSGTGGLY